jgi:hypothetical protein
MKWMPRKWRPDNRSDRQGPARGRTILAVAVLIGLLVVPVSQAVLPHASQAAKRHASKASGLRAPSLQSPSNGASVQALPTFTWATVAKATAYQFQLSADKRFGSVIQSFAHKGAIETPNTAATIDKAVPDDTYYWRVRAVSRSNTSGPWSAARRLVKKWIATPHSLNPSGTTIAWPAQPLVFSWAAVPYAVRYELTVATDETMASQVLGTKTSPITTPGTVYTPSVPLDSGAYWWQVTPIDAEGHKGTPSQKAPFTYEWLTNTTTKVEYLNEAQLGHDDPQFSWAPVPGAARYEVEANSAAGFPPGAKWCCSGTTIGTSMAPTKVLANNVDYWRVRAIDAKGHAGVWNEGPSFAKAFDNPTPDNEPTCHAESPTPHTPHSIHNLCMRDVEGNVISRDPETGESVIPSTDTPIVTWDPVPGASRYEVQLGPYKAGGCDWSLVRSVLYPFYHAETAATAWTPLGADKSSRIESAWPPAQGYLLHSLQAAGAQYCVRVQAWADDDVEGNHVVSTPTYVNPDPNKPAFTYTDPPPTVPTEGPLVTPLGAYIQPATGSHTTRTPLFTWHRVAGANGYYVVIAYDEHFTNVADVGFTNVPAYAPHLLNEEPLADETTSYYWAVLPTRGADGTELSSSPENGEDHPQSFEKSSKPPTPLTPTSGAPVANQPSFEWTPAENARTYRLQVSQDRSFGHPLEDVTTGSTGYTSSTTYPAGVPLYWRVRGNDWIGQGLNWSETQTFERLLPAPLSWSASPTGGESIPVLSWSEVPGAIGYEVHIDKVNGTSANLSVPATAAAPVEWFGVGSWRWRVRADFPTASSVLSVPGAYFEPPKQRPGEPAGAPFLRTLAAPTGARGQKSGARLVISWNPDPAAKQYEVDLSTSNGFARTIETLRTDNTTWAPEVKLTAAQKRGPLFWRVAAIDAGGNLGSFASGSLGRPSASCTSSHAKKGHKPTKKTSVCPKKKAATKRH